MLNFSYTLDNELEVPMGRIPSGIQTQAFEMALTRIEQRYRTTKRLLGQKVPGLGKGPVSGMSKGWQVRLISQVQFLDALPHLLLAKASNIALGDNSNAVLQGGARLRWNNWSQLALTNYARALSAFESEVEKGLTNAPVSGMPAALIRVAAIAGAPAPVLLDPKKIGLASLPIVDDPDYLADLDFWSGKSLFVVVLGAGAGSYAGYKFGYGRSPVVHTAATVAGLVAGIWTSLFVLPARL
jgi:hypothetical protein